MNWKNPAGTKLGDVIHHSFLTNDSDASDGKELLNIQFSMTSGASRRSNAIVIVQHFSRIFP